MKDDPFTPADFSILIVDDEQNFLRGLGTFLENRGYQIHLAGSGQRALKLTGKQEFDIILTDLKMPGISGLDLIRELKENNPLANIIVMTAYGTIDTAVEAMKIGVSDYLTKPLNLEELEICFKKAMRTKYLEEEVIHLRNKLRTRYEFANLVGMSDAMQDLYAMIHKVSSSKSTILLRGESGTGKELVARAIHELGPRRDHPFVSVSCAALPENLLESELFGHEKGAFTGAYSKRQGKFETAHKGTLFLDEIAEMSFPLQAKMLRVLEEREFTRVGGNETISVDIRLIAATNKNLEKSVQQGHFREDLYYRLNVIPILIPPLRNRKEDIPLLAAHFLKKYNQEDDKKIKGLSREAMNQILTYSWPGNVRELENAIRRAVVLCEEEVITLKDLPPNVRLISANSEEELSQITCEENSLSSNICALEKHLILKALGKTQGNISKAASVLGITYRCLRYKIQKYNLENMPQRLRKNSSRKPLPQDS